MAELAIVDAPSTRSDQADDEAGLLALHACLFTTSVRARSRGGDEVGDAGGDEQPEAGASLAQRIDHLIRTVHPGDRGPYTLEEITDGIRAQGGPTISVAYLSQLRAGKRDNPTKQHMEAIARFFGVNVAYFFDDTAAEAVNEELALLQAIRDSGVKRVALRAMELGPDARNSLARIIDELGNLEKRTSSKRRRDNDDD